MTQLLLAGILLAVLLNSDRGVRVLAWWWKGIVFTLTWLLIVAVVGLACWGVYAGWNALPVTVRAVLAGLSFVLFWGWVIVVAIRSVRKIPWAPEPPPL